MAKPDKKADVGKTFEKGADLAKKGAEKITSATVKAVTFPLTGLENVVGNSAFGRMVGKIPVIGKTAFSPSPA